MTPLLQVLSLALALAGGPEAAPAPLQLDDAALSAVVAAVRARLGASAQVTVESVIRLQAPAAVVQDAVLDPTLVVGAPSRVVFRTLDPRGGARLVAGGGATLVLQVVADHVHAARSIRRGQTLLPADLVPARHALARGPLRRLPGLDDLVGGLTLRDLTADGCIAPTAVAAQPAVRPGDEVTAVVRIDGVEARTILVAAEAGRPGARVRVINPESRRTFQARVLARALVEIQP